MVLDRLGTEEQGGGDLAVGQTAGRQQRHSGLLRGQRLEGQLIGDALGPGGEVHGREGVQGGPQLLAGGDPPPGPPQPGPVQQADPSRLEGVRSLGVGVRGGLEGLGGGGSQRLAAGDQGSDRQRGRLGGGGRRPRRPGPMYASTRVGATPSGSPMAGNLGKARRED